MSPVRILDAEQRVPLNVRIPQELHRAVQLYCLKHGLMIRDFMATVVAEALARASKGPRRESKAR
jgi:hypothetical protein